MRILAPLALAASAAFALAGCGHADDASQDAQADSVEIPADEALNNTPEPWKSLPWRFQWITS